MHSCVAVRRRRAISVGSIVLVFILFGWTNLVPPSAQADDKNNAASIEDLNDLQTRFKSIAAKVSPAVVAISASSQPDDSPAAWRVEEMTSDKLQAFLSKTTRMVGTGFIIDSTGYILTNDHVIDEGEQLWITTDDRKVYPAIIVGSDPRSDLAVLKVPGKHLPTVHMGDGATVSRGQWSVAIGNPFGLSGEGEMCLSVGVISAVNRSLPKLSDSENRLYTDLIQTTAQINPGNSGGPLFDLNGDVIGINTAVIMPQKVTNGIGFAMPINSRLLNVVEQLKQGNEVVYGYLGVVVSNPSDNDREVAGISQSIGARVDSVQPDSPAQKQSINPGDIITAIDGHVISNSEKFVQIIGVADIHHPVSIDLMRAGTAKKVRVVLSKRELPVAAVTRQTQHMRWAGMLVEPSDAGLIVKEINSASPFIKRGVREGAVIRSVAGRSVSCITDLLGIINDTPIDRCDVVLQPNPATVTADLPTGR
jgi:serine protease Do